MNRRLIVLALAFVVGMTCAAFAEVQNVKVSGEISTMAFTRYGFDFSRDTIASHTDRIDANGIASCFTVKVEADLTDAVAATIAIKNERVWGGTDTATEYGITTNASNGYAYIGQGFVTMKDVFGMSGVTVKAGLMPVKIGSGLLVADPTTNQAGTGAGPLAGILGDLNPRKSFTGAAAIWDLNPITVTAAALKVSEGSMTQGSDDVDAYVLNLGYDLANSGAVKSGILEVYDVYKDQKTTETVGTTATAVNAAGIRVQAEPVDNLSAGAEFAYQWQKGLTTNHKTATDSAVLLNASYAMPDVVWAPSFGLDYGRLSDHWNPMFEDLNPADIANALLPNTNVQVYGATLNTKPMEDLSLKLRYAYFRAVKVLGAFGNCYNAAYNVAAGKKELGNEVDLAMTYSYTEDVQFGLSTGYFKPGHAFAKPDRKYATQVIGSMKVTF